MKDLELPGFERRLDIISTLTEDKVGSAGVKRTVRAFNPAPKAKAPCYVCGRHRIISQSHHLLEVARVAKVLRAMAIYDWAPSIPMVSLCPNHHAYEHTIRRQRKEVPPEISRALNEELSGAEWDRLIEIDDRREEAHELVWQEVRREFLSRKEAYKKGEPDGTAPGG